MSSCPLGGSLCRTLQNQSTKTWQDLGDAEVLNTPLHETSITQYFALHLNRSHPNSTSVHSFKPAEEVVNGCDFLWIVREGSGTRCVKMAVQAKRLYPSGKYEAFNPAQVNKVMRFAQAIRGYGLYLTYNFDQLIPPHLIWSNWRRRLPINFCHLPMDAGLAFIPVDVLRAKTAATLTQRTLAAHGFPAWLPFCNCSRIPSSDGFESSIHRINAALFSQTRPRESTVRSEEQAESFITEWAGIEEINKIIEQLSTDEYESTAEFDPSLAIVTAMYD